MYDAAVFSAGGIRGIAQLGAVHALRKQHPEKLAHCRMFFGSSVGSIAAAFEATNTPPETALRDIIIPFEHNQNRFFQSGESLDEFVSIAVPDFTFQELRQTYGNFLAVVGTNVSRKQNVIFDPISTPDFSVRKALKISCSIPFVFPAVKIDDELYSDGAITNSFPIDIARAHGCNRIIGIGLDNEYRPGSVLESLIDLILSSDECVQNDETDVIRIKTPPGISGFRFDLSSEEKMQLFESGVECAHNFFRRK